ncbi:MAG: type II secretion system protein [Candidatus Omnitrophica bacterium]|nr:type II secretion system protein [Candidatus Omnitrophota bacterium]
MNKRAMTLAELIVVFALMCILLLSVYSVYLIFFTSINYDTERYLISGQVSYALSDMKVRCLSASVIAGDSRFDSEGESLEVLNFNGENDIYNITPDDLSDNEDYSYYVRENGDLIMEEGSGKTEVLVEGKYKPEVSFQYTKGNEPNFITVTVRATGTKSFGKDVPEVEKTEGIRFWFTDAVR